MENVGLMVALAGAMTKAPTAEQVKTAVDAWLDDHPEATTTVQDGAITNAKLASSFVTPGTASAYSSSATYAVGDYAFYNGSLYRCTTPITTAEAWTAAHWTAAVLGDDVGDLKTSLIKTVVPSSVEDGYISASGNSSPSDTYVCTDFVALPFLAGTKLNVKASLVGSVSTVIYADDKSTVLFYINGNNCADYGYAAGSAPQNIIITLPEGSAYLRATMRNSYYHGPSDFNIYGVDTGKLTELLDALDEDIQDNADGIAAHTEDIKYLLDTVNGESVRLYTTDYTVGRLVNGVPNTSAKNRVFTTNILTYPYDIVLSVDSGYRMGIAYYDANGNPSGTEPWNTSTLRISAGTPFRVMIANSPTDYSGIISDITPYVNAIHCTTNIQLVDKKIDVVKKYTTYINRMFYAVAHRGYSNTARPYGDSRLSSYKAAFEAGFNAAECDVQWAGDGTPVCSHDPTFTSNGTTVVIADHTVAELKEYDYFGETIATFEEVLQACKLYGLVLTIDKVSNEWTESNWETIFAIVQRNQMKGGVWWTCPDNTIGERILAYDKYATLIMLGTFGSINNRLNLANAIVTDFNTIIIATDYTNSTVADFIALSGQINRRNIWIGAYVINDADDYMDYMPYVMTITSDKYAPTMFM